MRVLLTGGGTGGHLFPLVAVARSLEETSKKLGILELEVIFIGPDKFSCDAFREESIKSHKIITGKFRRYISLQNFFDIFKLPIGFLQTLWHLFWFMPDIIFGKGGYGSFPVIILGWFFRIPIVIHESDAMPGLANRILSRFAKKIILSFTEEPAEKKSFPKKQTIVLGNPIRESILTICEPEEAKKFFNILSARPVVLVIGGSQGAKKINEVLMESLIFLIKKFEILHQCGEKNFRDIQITSLGILREPLRQHYHLYPFLGEKEMACAYSAADLIISRAGSGSIFEIAAVGKPSVIIPLATAASDHQRKNAQIFEENGACEVIEEANLTPHFFTGRVEQILGNPEALKKMSQAAQNFARPEAASRIAEEILKLGK